MEGRIPGGPSLPGSLTPSEEFMPYKKVLAGASLVLLAFAALPAAYAANDGDSSAPSSAPSQASPTAKPHRVMDPAKRAALKARRQARRLARQQQMQGVAPN